MVAALILILLAHAEAPSQASGPATLAWTREALTRALDASGEIADPFHRVQALAEISEAEAVAGDLEAAQRNLVTARALVADIEEEPLQSWALHDVGLAYVRADDLAAAEATAALIRDAALHDVVLSAVVDARRGARDIPGALAAARQIRAADRQGRSLRKIANLQASEHDFSGALMTARSIVDAHGNALALGDVAAALAREGDFEEARSLAARIRDAQDRSRAWLEVAIAQARLGDVTGAAGTARQIDDKLARAQALARIAAFHSAPAGPEARQMFAQSLDLVGHARAKAIRKGEALAEIARAQIIAGDRVGAARTLRRAVGVLGDVRNAQDKLHLVSRVAPLQARAGDFAGAFATAMRAEDASLRPLLVRDIAGSQAERGDVAAAVAASRTLDDRLAAAAALFGILRVQSRAQDEAGMRETIDSALEAVRRIGHPELRAAGLASLAAACAMQGDLEAARGHFREAMNTAAGLESPSRRAAAYTRIADALANRHRPFGD